MPTRRARRPVRTLRTLSHVLLLLLVGSACAGWEPCGQDSREVTVSHIPSGPAPKGSAPDQARVDLYQDHDELRSGSLQWSAQGAASFDSLYRHVVAARLRDAGAGGAVLLELPLDEPWQGITQGYLPRYTGSIPFADLFDLARAGRLVLELESDLPDEAPRSRALDDVSFRDWGEPACD
jgi:hypothetical protein